MTTLLLVRHGATQMEGPRRFIGQVDPPLGEHGRQQADQTGQMLAGLNLVGIFSSDLVRAWQTAEYISRFHALAVTPLPELREIALGAWDGLSMRQVKTEQQRAWQDRGKNFAGFRPPGGESFGDLQRRVVPALTGLAARVTGKLLLVTHAGVIRVFLCHVLGRPLQALFDYKLDYGALTRIDLSDGHWRLKGLNLSPESFCTRMG